MYVESAVMLCNPKTPFNVGGALRACAIFGADTLRWTGDRVTDGREVRNGGGTNIGKRAARLPREERMKMYHVDWGKDDDALDKFIDAKFTPVCVEILDSSEDLVCFEHPYKALYVFGPEDGHVPKGVRNNCFRFVRIPSRSCLNLAAAVNVVLYDRVVKLGEIDTLNQIKKPRGRIMGHV